MFSSIIIIIIIINIIIMIKDCLRLCPAFLSTESTGL
jgi:hypothetical protein